ncbi:SDR family oxidoreductase [Spirosoma linguale]|uniref:NmrA family protein n=1 Tax=Spirosoma linguale (strain ATCC 33905 / DSM 74 / LMG 10896 / Claus 1) TaxID=504472 RepID=D2QPU7_SPILD|nr:NmrA family protein [Spirosoma linguale DSM 74]
MNDKLLITSATGKTGYAATLELLNGGHPVRIYVRSRNAKAIDLENRGAEIVIGLFDSYAQWRHALTGVKHVYYCYPMMKGLPENLPIFIEAAKDASIDTVVFMGQRIAEYADTGSLLTNDIRTAYRLLEQSGLNVIYFKPGYFADNAFVVTQFVLQLGLMANPFGSGKNPWISTGDLGRCIAALLKNPTPYVGQQLVPTGPKSISSFEMAAIFSSVSEQSVRTVPLPDWLFLKAGIKMGQEFGFDRFSIVQATFYNKQMRLNRFDTAPTDVVKRLTGREPEDFTTITRQYFDKSPYRIRRFSSWLLSLKKFMLLPFTPTPNAAGLAALNQ